VLLATVDAGLIPLRRAIEALTIGPAAVLGPSATGRPMGLVEGAPADLVVFDRSDAWRVDAGSLASKGRNSPLLGRELPGRMLLAIAGGRLAWDDAS
jgi:dihydroorotase